MKRTSRAVYALLALAWVNLAASAPAGAHPPNGQASEIGGAYTFYAGTQLSSPADSATYVENPITFSSSINHFVKVTGPENDPGTTVNYEMRLFHDATDIGNSVANSVSTPLDAMGQWTEQASLLRDLTLGNGNHTAKATSKIVWTVDPTVDPDSQHVHGFAVSL